MKKINIGGFNAVSLGTNPGSCSMEEVVILNTCKFKTVLGNIPDVYIDPRKESTKNNLFLLMGTREQYIQLTGKMKESPWFVDKLRFKKYFT